MNGKLTSDDTDTTTALNEWLAERGPAWAQKVRGIYGDSADDVLAMVLGEVCS